jgi:hypothetical protein
LVLVEDAGFIARRREFEFPREHEKASCF